MATPRPLLGGIFDPEELQRQPVADQNLPYMGVVSDRPEFVTQPYGGDVMPPGVMEETPLPPKVEDGIRLRDQPGPAPSGDKKEDSGSIWDSAENLREQQQAEREALQAELAARRAQAIQQGEARAGAAGMGLSGATGAQIADIGRVQGREADLALAQLGRRQRDEGWQQMQRSIALWDFEESDNKDYDGDGFIGKPPGADEATTDQRGMQADSAASEVGLADLPDQQLAYVVASAQEIDAPPEGSTYYRSDANYDLYLGKNGMIYKVRKKEGQGQEQEPLPVFRG